MIQGESFQFAFSGCVHTHLVPECMIFVLDLVPVAIPAVLYAKKHSICKREVETETEE